MEETKIQLRVLDRFKEISVFNRNLDSVIIIAKIKNEFDRIDNIMKTLKVGDTLFLEDIDGGYEIGFFEQKVVEIVNVELGIITCIEPNTFGARNKQMNINSLITETEFIIKFPESPTAIESKLEVILQTNIEFCDLKRLDILKCVFSNNTSEFKVGQEYVIETAYRNLDDKLYFHVINSLGNYSKIFVENTIFKSGSLFTS